MRSFRCRATLALGLLLALHCVAPDLYSQYLRGLTLAGPEFNEKQLPGRDGHDYTFNSERSFEFFATRRLNVIRVPVRWERLQPSLFGPLDPEYLQGLRNNIGWAHKHGAVVIIDVHNYGRYIVRTGAQTVEAVLDTAYDGQVLAPAEALIDLWLRLSEVFAGDDGVLAYGLMNEPHDMGAADWKAISQRLVTAIRAAGDETLIMVAGDSWSSAERWRQTHGPDGWIDDPADNFAYEAHVYFDQDASGRYVASFDAELAANPDLLNIGVRRLEPFRQWCQDNGVRCYLGELGVPGDEPGWLEALERFLSALDEAGMDATYWAAGEMWGDYRLSIQPGPGFDVQRPQLAILEKHLGVDHLALVSAASFAEGEGAPGSLVSAFGVGLAGEARAAESVPLPRELAEVEVELEDMLGRLRTAELIYVSPRQVNFLLPEDLALGPVAVGLRRRGTRIAGGRLELRRLTRRCSRPPATARPPAALLTTVKPDGEQIVTTLAAYDPDARRFLPTPIRFGTGERLFVSFFGTGFRGGAAAESFVDVGAKRHALLYLGRQPQVPGLDQANIERSGDLAGSCQAAVRLTVESRVSNTLALDFVKPDRRKAKPQTHAWGRAARARTESGARTEFGAVPDRLRSDGDLDDLLLDGVLHELRLVVDVELAHQVELVRLDRLHAQIQVLRDLLHRLAFGEELEDLLLARRQRGEARLAVRGLDPRPEVVH